MSSYDLLNGLLVIEVAQLGPDALGGYLADMGARVVKVEAPPAGDPVRYAGEHAVGGPDGCGFLHLRWNRGKQSVCVDLRSTDGRDVFMRLAERADVVIEGLKGGTLDRLELGYNVLARCNPRLVFCSLSGFGMSGPYYRLGSHGPTFDAFAGLLPHDADAVAVKRSKSAAVPIGMHAMGVYAAIAVLAAVFRARTTGHGGMVEVAAADAAANWLPDYVDPILNASVCQPRAGFADEDGLMKHWPRFHQYRTRDGRVVFFQAPKNRVWEVFCAAVDRSDLAPLGRATAPDDTRRLWRLLVELFSTRDLADWLALFEQHGIPGGPVNDVHDLASDAHFEARGSFYPSKLPTGETLRLTGTPIKVHGQHFAPTLAPDCGQHTETVLAELAGLDRESIVRLRRSGVVA